MENKMKNVEIFEKGKILKEALKIVDKLAENDLGDMDGTFSTDEFESEELQVLIVRARKLKKNRFFILKQILIHNITVFILNECYEKKKELLD